MKSSKSNTQIPVATKKISLRYLRYDVSATLRSLSEQPFDFMMHHNGHREYTAKATGFRNLVSARSFKARRDLDEIPVADQAAGVR